MYPPRHREAKSRLPPAPRRDTRQFLRNRRFRPSGLDLVVAALWIRVYLERAAAALPGNARSIRTALPYRTAGLDHINLRATTSGAPASASLEAVSGPSAAALKHAALGDNHLRFLRRRRYAARRREVVRAQSCTRKQSAMQRASA